MNDIKTPVRIPKLTPYNTNPIYNEEGNVTTICDADGETIACLVPKDIADQIVSALNAQQPCKTIKVFDIDMTLEEVLQNVLANIQMVDNGARYLTYAEIYCQAAYDFVRTKPNAQQPKCPNCGKTGEAAKLPHSCQQPAEPSGELATLIELLKIYAETDSRVSQKFYQGLCLKAKVQLEQAAARIEALENAITWAVERMDEEPAKEVLKAALGKG